MHWQKYLILFDLPCGYSAFQPLYVLEKRVYFIEIVGDFNLHHFERVTGLPSCR